MSIHAATKNKKIEMSVNQRTFPTYPINKHNRAIIETTITGVDKVIFLLSFCNSKHYYHCNRKEVYLYGYNTKCIRTSPNKQKAKVK